MSDSWFTYLLVLTYLQVSCWSVFTHCLHAQHCNTGIGMFPNVSPPNVRSSVLNNIQTAVNIHASKITCTVHLTPHARCYVCKNNNKNNAVLVYRPTVWVRNNILFKLLLKSLRTSFISHVFKESRCYSSNTSFYTLFCSNEAHCSTWEEF